MGTKLRACAARGIHAPTSLGPGVGVNNVPPPVNIVPLGE